MTMIFDAVIYREPPEQFLLRERPSAETRVLRPLFGLFPLAVGSLVVYTFLSGGGPTPMGGFAGQVFGWLVIALFFLALGVAPLGWGLSVLLVRHTYALRPDTTTLEVRTSFAGAPVWRASYPFGSFKEVEIRTELYGVFGKRLYYVVGCGGRQQIDLSAFAHRVAAESVAAQVAGQMGLPVVARNGL